VIFLICLLITSTSFGQSLAEKSPAASNSIIPLPRVFVNSVVYGVGAGMLVGLADLTGFRKNIRANMDFGNVARGASWGLYAGILLGFYLMHLESNSEAEIPNEQYDDQYYPEGADHNLRAKIYSRNYLLPEIQPLFENSQFTGLSARWTLYSF
jgi:hypothetical protein